MRSNERAALLTSIAPDGLKLGHILAAAERVGGPGQLHDRTHLIAEEKIGREQQQQAECDRPHDEDVRVDDDHALAVHARFQQPIFGEQAQCQQSFGHVAVGPGKARKADGSAFAQFIAAIAALRRLQFGL
jgi:hypothetical protein